MLNEDLCLFLFAVVVCLVTLLMNKPKSRKKKNGSYSMMFRSPAKFLLTCFFYDHKHALPKVSIEMFKSRTAHMHWDHFEEKGLNWYLNYLKYFFVQLLRNYTQIRF